MKEEYFEGLVWTRTFVSGPVDPKWNPYKFYCQICKGNISIYGKGARAILRHYATEKHLRNDQRWRYERLVIEDPDTKTITFQVRGRDGKILTHYQLEFEIPNFNTAEQLVVIGKTFPSMLNSWPGPNKWSHLQIIVPVSKSPSLATTFLPSKISGLYEICRRT